MAQAEYTTTAKLPIELIWSFVEEMDNWAHFFMGYQQHQKESDTLSTWVLKGDLGAMTRTLKFRVHITDWSGPERVAFEIEGLNEPMKGEGTFVLARYEEATSTAAPAASKKNFLLRWLESLFRFFFQWVRGKPTRAASADTGPGEGVSRLTFRLSVSPGGPMAPMIDAMIKPMMPSFAEDFAGKLVGHLEAQHGTKS